MKMIRTLVRTFDKTITLKKDYFFSSSFDKSLSRLVERKSRQVFSALFLLNSVIILSLVHAGLMKSDFDSKSEVISFGFNKESSRYTLDPVAIRSYEDGSVVAIHVNRGDEVKFGDDLITLEFPGVIQEHEKAEQLLGVNLVLFYRSKALVEALDENKIPILNEKETDLVTQEALSRAESLIKNRYQLWKIADERFESLIRKKEAEYQTKEAQIAKTKQNIELIAQEVEDYNQLIQQKSRGLSKHQYNSKKQDLLDAEYSLSSKKNELVIIRELIQQLILERDIAKYEIRQGALNDIQRSLESYPASLIERERAAHMIQKSHIKAPSDGIVGEVSQLVTGGYISQGESLMKFSSYVQNEETIQNRIRTPFITSTTLINNAIKSYEDGSILSVNVKNGDAVKSGDLLLTLEFPGVKQDYQRAELDLGIAVFQHYRATALLEALDLGVLPILGEKPEDDLLEQALYHSQKIIHNRYQLWLAQDNRFEALVRQKESSYLILNEKIRNSMGKIILLKEELQDYEKLINDVNHGISKHNYNEKKQAYINATYTLESEQYQLVEIDQELLLLHNERDIHRFQFKQELLNNLQDAQEKIPQYIADSAKAKHMLMQAEMRAPNDGVVDKFKMNLVGGFISQGEELMIIKREETFKDGITEK